MFQNTRHNIYLCSYENQGGSKIAIFLGPKGYKISFSHIQGFLGPGRNSYSFENKGNEAGEVRGGEVEEVGGMKGGGVGVVRENEGWGSWVLQK